MTDDMTSAELDDAEFARVLATMPIPAVDVVGLRRDADEDRFGLVLRESPFDGRLLWTQIGGRVRRGETLREALLRHVHGTLVGATLDLDDDPQPDYVLQFFPVDPPAAPIFGVDPRKHSIGMSFLLEIGGDPDVVPGGEGLELRWFTRAELTAVADDLWPGTGRAVEQLARRRTTTDEGGDR
jgi:ADP-ribose pyrophosphatase YjhB (NUDIX family)